MSLEQYMIIVLCLVVFSHTVYTDIVLRKKVQALNDAVDGMDAVYGRVVQLLRKRAVETYLDSDDGDVL